MRISDWSSDVCSSDLQAIGIVGQQAGIFAAPTLVQGYEGIRGEPIKLGLVGTVLQRAGEGAIAEVLPQQKPGRSEEHTSELQSLMRISYSVFCLTQKPHGTTTHLGYPLLTYCISPYLHHTSV